MGRRSAKIPTGHFYIKNSANKDGVSVIYVRYYVCGKYVEHSTDIRIPVADWLGKTERLSSSNRNSRSVNTRLDHIRTAMDNQIMTCEETITPDIVRDMLNGCYVPPEKRRSKTDFIQFALDYNEQRYRREQIAFTTFDNGRLSILAFRNYLSQNCGVSSLAMDELNVDIFNRYINWRIETRGNTPEGVNKTLTPLYKAVRYAMDIGELDTRTANTICDNYLEIKSRKYSSDVEEREVRYLTEQQLFRFTELYDTVKYNATRKIMDIFLFSVYTCGLRFSDLMTLEWKHIYIPKKVMKKNIFKNKSSLEIPLNDEGIAILRKWKGVNRRFVFDMLPADFDLDDEQSLKNRRLSKNRNVQQSLKSVGRKMNLKFNLTIHVARHTFAVLAIQKGMNIYQLSKLMGHSSVTTTEKVYAEFIPEQINEDVRSRMKFRLPESFNSKPSDR